VICGICGERFGDEGHRCGLPVLGQLRECPCGTLVNVAPNGDRYSFADGRLHLHTLMQKQQRSAAQSAPQPQVRMPAQPQVQVARWAASSAYPDV